jgi:predicted dehydrogenase
MKRVTPATTSVILQRGISRRKFLQYSALTAGAATLGGCATPHVAGAATPAKSGSGQLNVAIIGCGTQGRSDMTNFISVGANIIALCDADQEQIGKARKMAGSEVSHAKDVHDYRQLLDDKSLHAVVIATPDHWHAPLAKAFMQAGKNVYCEKPLAHTLGEVRQLRQLSKSSSVVTQMGNQGSASNSLRRCVEVIQAGALGQIHEVHAWCHGGPFPRGTERPVGEDPVPAGFNWDYWVGPAAMRPYKDGAYHPYNWHTWYDFGTGQIGNFACHCLNLPVRALKLGYAQKIDLLSKPGNDVSYPFSNIVKYSFAERSGMDPVNVFWYDGGPSPDAALVKPVTSRFKKGQSEGVLIVGEKGIIFTDLWNKAGMIKLTTDSQLTDIMHHAPTAKIPVTLPRVPRQSHQQEFLDACKGGPKTFSDFETGGHLSEIPLSGLIAIRLGRSIEWDGENMQVKGDPDTQKFIQPTYREKWL